MRFAPVIFATFLLCSSSRTAFAADSSSSVEVYVWGQQPTSAATEQTRWDKDLELRPSNTPSDVMRLTPGLIIGQHHGGGKSDQILFRGFDSDHGTDFAVFVDGVPVNMVSHAHGQGYADLHWLIPETIERVEIYKGPYFVQLGDFATSGAMNITTKKKRQRQHAHAYRRELQYPALRRHTCAARRNDLESLYCRRDLP
jgi:outer membrane receptor for ferrienterochelin and colicin